jgi:hypothetical protein
MTLPARKAAGLSTGLRDLSTTPWIFVINLTKAATRP